MSEMTATFTFTAPADQSKYWQVLLQGMANEELGAYMEDRVEPFGEAAERALEHFLDEYEDFHLSYYGYKHQVKKGVHHFAITMQGGGSATLCLKDFIALLTACGAENINKDHLVL